MTQELDKIRRSMDEIEREKSKVVEERDRLRIEIRSLRESLDSDGSARNIRFV